MWVGQRRLKYLVLKDQKCTFVFGALIGALLAVIVHTISRNPLYVESIWPSQTKLNDHVYTYEDALYDFVYENWLSKSYSGQSCSVDPDILRYSNETEFQSKNCGPLSAESSKKEYIDRDRIHIDPRTEAQFLFDKIDITCLILVKNERVKATAIKETWGTHCNDLKFVSHKDLTTSDKKTNSSILTTNPAKIDRIKSTSEFGLLCKSLRQIWNTRNDKLMWVLIGEENIFALPENLRFYVAAKDFKENHYLGHAMKFWNIIYNWADAGYVISKGTLEVFVKQFKTDADCDNGGKYWKNSDWYLGKHLAENEIYPEDTRDHIGRSRFIGHSLRRLLFPGGVSLFDKYWRDSLYLSPDGPHCCSNFAITFQLSTSTTRMFQFYYLYYHLKSFSGGGKYGNRQAPQRRRSSQSQALTLDEKLKEEALEKIFLGKLKKP